MESRPVLRLLISRWRSLEEVMAMQQSSFVALVVGALLTPLTVCALEGSPQAEPSPEAPVPTTIERALIDRVCRTTELSTQIEAHRQCLDAQLQSLRTDFGRDLSRLPAGDRRRIDAACSRLSAAGQREAYLDCLSGQLVVLHNRKNRGTPAAVDETPVAVPASAPEPVTTPAPKNSSWAATAMIVGTVGTVLCAAGFVFMSRRPRHTARPCRTCGVSVPDSDLCPTCRHEAAEALRHANAERIQHQKAQEEQERRQREYEAEQAEQRARDAEDARVRELELARHAQAEQERARQSEAVRVAPVREAGDGADDAAALARQGAEGATAADAFDPYAILRVARDASPDAIHAAYQLAKSKYDPDVVSHLGDEAQAHFKAKAEAVELAYQTLSAGN